MRKMDDKKVVFALLTATLLLFNSSQSDAEVSPCDVSPSNGCQCYSSAGSIRVTCSDYTGNTAPPGISENVTYLSISGAAKLKKLQKLDFQNATRMQTLIISDSTLEEIEPEAFDTMTDISLISIHDTQLREIPDFLFARNNKLSELLLFQNNISQISVNTFVGLTGLRVTLDIGRNKIDSLPDNAFVNLTNLERLVLTNNQLSSLSSKVFNGLSMMTSLSVDQNVINAIDPGTFEATPYLSNLKLSNNMLTDLDEDTFSTTGYLATLELGANQFKDIPSRALKGAVSLEKLNLDNNIIGKASKGALSGLNKLKSLSISYNDDLLRLESGALSGLRAIESVKVVYNSKLTYVPPDVITNNANLVGLLLNNNSIVIFDQELFGTAPQLTLADIHGNEIMCNCSAKWMPQVIKDPQIYPWAVTWRDVTCAAPQSLIGVSISALPEEELTCDPPILSAPEDQADGRSHRFSVMMRGGVPWSRWELPDGTTVQPQPTFKRDYTGAAHMSNVQATEERFSNFTVRAQLYVDEALNGKYTLLAENAGGLTRWEFAITGPTPASGNLTEGPIAAIVISALLAVTVVIVFAYARFRRWRENNPYGRMRNIEKTAGTDGTSAASEEASGIAQAHRSYGGVANEASATGPTNQSQRKMDGTEIFA